MDGESFRLHGDPAVQGGTVGHRGESSTAPTSDTLSSADSLSQRSVDFGLPGEDSRAGADPLLGADLGGIRIERLVGEGGMGRVYEARQLHPDRSVAVKVMRLPAMGTTAAVRFRREAEALARLRHPGIAQIFMAGCHRLGGVEVPYYVMEFIPGGQTLVEACRRRAAPVREKLDLLLAVADAVGHGHTQGIVHRDLKPGNILVDPAGRPKIIDFGIARMDGAGDDPNEGGLRTATGQFMGTRPYMAPEQFADNRTAIDARTDVYALGVVMHELLAGRLPYDVSGKSLVETARVVQQMQPARIVAPGCPPADRKLLAGADAIAGRCLAKEPAFRYATAADLAADLRRLLTGERLLSGTPRSGGMRAARQLVGEYPVRSALVAIAAVLLAVAAWGRQAAKEQPAATGPIPAAAVAPLARSQARPIGVRFATVSSGRTTPLEWVDLTFDEDVSGLAVGNFRLSRNAEPIPVSGLDLKGGPRSWRVGGLEQLTTEAGDYRLAFVGGPESPREGSGFVVSGSAAATWRSPPFRRIRLSPLDDGWDSHVVSRERVERYTERHAGATTFIRPTEPGREGSITLKFDVPFAIQDATVIAPLAVWTTGDPFPYDPGARAALDVSADGEAWTTVVERKAGAGGFDSDPHDIGGIVAGGRQIWVRARLTATREWPGDGLIFAQFLRTDPQEPGAGFVLTATGPHPPVIPQADR